MKELPVGIALRIVSESRTIRERESCTGLLAESHTLDELRCTIAQRELVGIGVCLDCEFERGCRKKRKILQVVGVNIGRLVAFRGFGDSLEPIPGHTLSIAVLGSIEGEQNTLRHAGVVNMGTFFVPLDLRHVYLLIGIRRRRNDSFRR